jgi:hypothetical protein
VAGLDNPSMSTPKTEDISTDIREVLLKARELFLKIGDPDETVATTAAAQFRALMDEWGITLENMQRFSTQWRPIALKAVELWRESRLTHPLDSDHRRPKKQRAAWLLWQVIEDALEMIAILNLREPTEDDSYYQKVYEQASTGLKSLVEAGKFPRDLTSDRAFQRWRTDWDC